MSNIATPRFPVAGGYQARNPGQQWQTRFDGQGFIVQPEPRSSRREEALTSSAHPVGKKDI